MMQNKKSFTVDELQKKMEYYCVYQDRCHQEVERKMAEYQLIPEAKEKILLYLMEHNFLNEERFSKAYVRGKFNQNKWGKIKITNELKFKNISSYNIKTGLKEISEEKYINTLQKLAEKKNAIIKESNLYKRRSKLYTYLASKGYETNYINNCLKAILQC